ncbi:MAG TPA: SUMF1/EgtB/PvdO family nonheme iron enzyme [Flavobacteriales bacterium]|nr:SUMF1/EgtB/PvdO family nonheme iron enzyme [Flavobacteriales bacterium]HMR29235.1 SUMF1/EgtB/PvdO family nonheme iron enzyme [Flavobacteriales bacterium]
MNPLLHRLSPVLFTAVALCSGAQANNIQVSNATLTGNDGTAGICFVQFDLSWQNSWRGGGATNNDAAWVFAKFKTGAGVWHHVRLSNTGHVAPSGSQIDLGLLTPGSAFNATTNPVLGTFIRRNAEGTGTFTATGVQLRWTYGAQGLAFNDITELRVYAIEMVLVNGGAFAAGSGGTAPNEFTLTTITTANASTAPSGTGALGGQAGGHPTGSSPGGNAAYPNGFNAYYCMKYEISQQQYVEFLNTLTRGQQDTRTGTALGAAVTSVTNRFVMSNSATQQNRNGIRCDATVAANDPIVFYCDADGNGTGGEAPDGLWLACNFLSWPDVGAYLDWSGLRPMSELEYEKACRGGLPPVAQEFAWGTTTIALASYFLANDGRSQETIEFNYSLTGGNCNRGTPGNFINGPVRVGIFAANGSNTGRMTAGAGAPGIMELSGNVSEFVVDLFDLGVSYTGLHGDGILQADGGHTTAQWPNNVSGDGATIRGGGFAASSGPLRTSDRSSILSTGWGTRFSSAGGRGARTAP